MNTTWLFFNPIQNKMHTGESYKLLSYLLEHELYTPVDTHD